MRNIMLTISYDGSLFFGFQKQENVVTIQGEIEDALKKITGENINIISAGRTDRGVHSLRHIINFHTESNVGVLNFKTALNHFLPIGVRVLDSKEVSENFHSRFDAKMKTYKYILNLDEVMDPIYYNYKANFPYPLDIDKMQRAKEFFIGRRSFKAFMGPRTGNTNPIREISSFEIYKENNDLIFLIKGQSFIRNQVRIMVGTLVDIGRGLIEEGELEKILDSEDRTKAGVTLSPNGLYLMEILYDKF
ncbi:MULTISPECIES: tRNA pseudouridine(38-40) synthase TruA [unclassified Parvimonas]|uniref:tRNA pseudouridine(38-40) synthase TruA n=1 Tax=unclassified Parvimonas TaxID=1151464 RepID=UPI002B460D33|nr:MULTISPECIES: tRNA pseudouridine(38-40) synthase TruA [unclassified Parvimonas]MEB3025427.1 tRNA pseudouridine(38-40) synthase TruA [Parvimonas sp. M13]MEB3089525.1 tRNA pseudouridine(38-40) synthase TruA [Parvimonas sp. M20]